MRLFVVIVAHDVMYQYIFYNVSSHVYEPQHRLRPVAFGTAMLYTNRVFPTVLMVD